MWKTKELGKEIADTDARPFLYEVRVKGHLSAEQWTSWFDSLTVTTGRGESVLRGVLPDHAALYALLARLRDLAVPLVGVRVLDADAQLRLYRKGRRYDLMITLLLVTVYLALLGGLSAITVFIAPIIDTALALTLLFASLGGLAHAFWLQSGQNAWRWITFLAWPAAALTFLIYTSSSGLLPSALAIAVMLLLGAGGLVYLVNTLRRRADDVKDSIVDAAGRRWESLDSARGSEPGQAGAGDGAQEGER